MKRATLPFRATDGDGRYLTRDGVLGEESDAVTFTLHRSPLVRERHHIDRRIHDLAGGLEAWLDLQEGIVLSRRRVNDEIAAQADDDDDTTAKTPEDRRRSDAELEIAWGNVNPKLRAGLIEMLAMTRRLEWMASWAVLFVSAEDASGPLADWNDVAELPLSPEAMDVLWAANDAAREESDQATGKTPPSAS
tara:strand:+ start:1045 stop:1620 length:576 start_codon:yes stop_codon:yes gene_type:complete